jgi:predicted nucleic acid-binding protein
VVVIDSSIFLAATMPDELSHVAQTILAEARQDKSIVPAHFHIEVANSLTVNLRRSRLNSSQRAQTLGHLIDFPCNILSSELINATSLADEYGLTLYDAAYLELAQRLKYPLATLDRKLAAAAAMLNILHPAIASSWLSA